MHSENTPEDGTDGHPLFIKHYSYYYSRSRWASRIKDKIVYSTPHEVILNLHAFHDDDLITYINRATNDEVFTITVERFKFRIAESIYEVTHYDLELLYMRLLLSNLHSRTIIDKGIFRQLDSVLRKYLLTLKGGTDCYLAYEKDRVVFYFKYRRLSSIYLLAVIENWNLINTIQFNYINIPKIIPNQGVLFDCLRVQLNKNQFRIYNYDPLEEDNIQPTKIDREIIQVINQLIK